MTEEEALSLVDPNPRISNLYWRIYDAARRGISKKDIAKTVGISPNLLTQWIKQDAELRDLFENINNDPLVLVEDAMQKLAIGFTEVEETVEMEASLDDGGMTTTKVKKVCKTSKPDLNAQKFILTNKKSEDWKVKPEDGGNEEIKISFDPALRDV
jgi:predicted transcriptional regulator